MHLNRQQHKDYAKAYQHVKQAVNLVPKHAGALSDLAYTELRLGRYNDAYQHYLQAIQASGANVNTNLYDGLTEVCHHLKKKKKQSNLDAWQLQLKRISEERTCFGNSQSCTTSI